ncbi:MAG TPA: helix-turn-helix domain-containing protein [Phycisphaerae bacterium]|nr:helix-turn-helix domain-containing protein [Phycisphaerae bacterium]
MSSSAAIQVLQQPDQGAVLLHPIRLRLVGRLAEPNSATGLAREMGLPRQKINYHLRELEKNGLVRFVKQQRKGNCLERIVQATARSYLISPEVLGSLASDPSRIPDRFSSGYMVAVAARTIRELAILQHRADKAKQPLPTFNLQADIRFASAEDRNGFAEELTQEVARLTAKYHHETAPGGRLYRFFVGGYPAITKGEEETPKSQTIKKSKREA